MMGSETGAGGEGSPGGGDGVRNRSVTDSRNKDNEGNKYDGKAGILLQHC